MVCLVSPCNSAQYAAILCELLQQVCRFWRPAAVPRGWCDIRDVRRQLCRRRPRPRPRPRRSQSEVFVSWLPVERRRPARLTGTSSPPLPSTHLSSPHLPSAHPSLPSGSCRESEERRHLLTSLLCSLQSLFYSLLYYFLLLLSSTLFSSPLLFPSSPILYSLLFSSLVTPQ